MKKAYQGLVTLLVAALCSGQDMSKDPCVQSRYQTLQQPYRSTGYDLRTTDTPKCDNDMQDGWYIFVDVNGAPVTMPTACPGRNTCGTETPYWLNGTHPTGDSIITITLCAKTNDDPKGTCCDIMRNGFVKKCTGFYVYYLLPTRSCPRAYCAGNMRRCPVGTWSPTDFPVCRDRFPLLKTPPEVKGPIVNGDQTVQLTCQIVYDKNEADQRFEVTWTFDGKPDPNIHLMILAGIERAATLNAQQLKNHIDQEVECQVRAYYEGREHDKSNLIPSKSLFFGIQERPELRGPNVRGTAFDFQCLVTFGNYDPDQQIEVVWTFDGTTDDAFKPQILTNGRRSTTLDGATLANKINKNIGCQARLVYANDVKTIFRKSKDYFFGIKVDPETNIVIDTSDRERDFTITSTIPIVCDEGQNCCLTFKPKVNTKSVVSFKNTCEHKICSAAWNPQTSSATAKITLVPVRNAISAGTRTTAFSIDILTSGTGRYISLFGKHKLPSVLVTVNIKAGFLCSITGDPHVIGFDYKHSYHFYEVGEYIAYTVDDRNFQVQVKTWECYSPTVTCVCGVVVREQNNIIRVNGCDRPGNLFASTITIPYNLAEGAVVMRSQNGHHIGITLLSGSELAIDLGDWYMQVYIRTPAFDVNKARGICGTNDGNQNNDFTHLDGTVTDVCPHHGGCRPTQFTESWRVTNDRSLFVKIPPRTKVDVTEKYCSCDSTQTSTACSSSQHSKQTVTVCNGCQVITDKLQPNPWGTNPTIAMNSDKHWSSDYDISEDEPNNERRRRSNDQVVEDLVANKEWPNKKGVTKDQASEMCSKGISSTQLYNQCSNDNTMMDNAMSDCLSDILIGDTTEAMDAIKSSFTTHCQEAMAKDENNYQETDGVLAMKPVFMDFVCPLECLQHGSCGPGGKCVCNNGWEGDACHIEVGKGPQISWTNSGAMCYSSEKYCDSVNLMVSNVNLLDDLTCQVYILDNSDKKSNSPHKSGAVREGSPEAKCSLPQTGASTLNFSISVTKDEKLFSNEMRINTFDSTCLSCTDTGCKELKTACHIDNVCYKDGERNKNNAGLICDVSKHTSAWSPAPSNSGRTTKSLLSWMNILAGLLMVSSTLSTVS